MKPDEILAFPGTTSQRVERKYPLCVIVKEEAINALRAIRPVYRYDSSGDWSSIRTTYLDTLNFQCYQEYLQDLPIRRKVRIRQYGVNGRFGDTCWFEMKLKNERVSMKRRFQCSLEDAARMLKGENILDRIGPAGGPDLRRAYHLIFGAITEQELVPVVRVDYERISFQDPADPNLRLTLDRQLRFCSASREHRGRLEGLVLEIKYTGDQPAWLPILEQRISMKRIIRYSKFGRAMKRLAKLREEVSRP